MKPLLLGCSLLLLAQTEGCPTPPPEPPRIEMTSGQAEIQSGSRFRVNCEAIFRDDLAYREKRAIYVITDTQTGKRYVGVSGIGISELGDHSDGDDTVRDER
jgi:hypothetical protein